MQQAFCQRDSNSRGIGTEGMSIRGDIRLNPVVHGWQHNPSCQSRGLFRPRAHQSFEDVGVPEPVVRGMSKEGMRSVQREQASVITLMLSRQSALVICPEAAEPLYFLRSSICAASLTLATTTIPAIQVVILTPTDNLARALYRPLEGYARFCELGARICSGPCGTNTSAFSPGARGQPQTPSPNRNRRYGGLTMRGLTTPHILLGTPEAVLAQLIDDEAPAVAAEVLLVACHAHSIFDDAARELELAAIVHRVCPSQVIVCANQESEVAPQCDALFADLQRLFPYSSASDCASGGHYTSSKTGSCALSSDGHGVESSGHSSDCEGRLSPGALPGWSAPVAPWLPKRSGRAGGPQDDAHGADLLDAQLLHHTHGRLRGAGPRGAGRTMSARQNMRPAILPAGYMPEEVQVEARTLNPLAGPRTQLRRELTAGGMRWKPVSRHTGFRESVHGPAWHPRSPGTMRRGRGKDWGDCECAGVQDSSQEVPHWWDALKKSAAAAADSLCESSSLAGMNGSGGDREQGPFPVCDDDTEGGAVKACTQKNLSAERQCSVHLAGDAQARPQPQRPESCGGKQRSQLTEGLRGNASGKKGRAAKAVQRDVRKAAREPADAVHTPPVSAEEPSEGVIEGLKTTEVAGTPQCQVTPVQVVSDAVCGSCDSMATGRCSSASFTAWTAQSAQKAHSPAARQLPMPAAQTVGLGPEDGAVLEQPAWRQHSAPVPVPSAREVEQLSAAVRRGLSLQGADGVSYHGADCDLEGRKPVGHAQEDAQEELAEPGGHVQEGTQLDFAMPIGARVKARTQCEAQVSDEVSVVTPKRPGNSAGGPSMVQTAVFLVSSCEDLAAAASVDGGASESSGPAGAGHAQQSRQHVKKMKKATWSADTIAQARAAAAEAICAAQLQSKAAAAALRASTRSPSQADDGPMSWRSKLPSASEVTRQQSPSAPGACVGIAEVSAGPAPGLPDPAGEMVRGSRKSATDPGHMSKKVTAKEPAANLQATAKVTAASSARACGPDSPARRPHAAGNGCAVCMPPHFKSLPFVAVSAGEAACAKGQVVPRLQLRESGSRRSGKRSESEVTMGGELHAADKDAPRGTDSSERPDEAAEKEHCCLSESLLRVSSCDHSDYTVMAYTGSMKHGMALSPGADGMMPCGDGQSSSGGLASIATSPPLLEPCQGLQGNSDTPSGAADATHEGWVQSGSEHPVQPEPTRAPLPHTPPAADALDRPGCMLMHDPMVMRQLCGAAPAPRASPAAISLVTAALERMAATDHATASPRRPAVDSYSRYAQACAALVAAPESPSHTGTAKHSTAACVNGTGATAAVAATHSGLGSSASKTRVHRQEWGEAKKTRPQGCVAGERTQVCSRVSGESERGSEPGGMRERPASGGVVKHVAEAVGPHRLQMIGDVSRQNFLRLFSQDELDLAEDLAFSCAAVEEM